MKALLVATTAVVMAASSLPAMAHSVRPLQYTLENQVGRIHLARRVGDLTWFEKRKLLAEQRAIARRIKYIKADGVVTGYEFRSVRRAQRRASRHIWAESNDNQIARWKRFLSGRYGRVPGY